MSKREKRVVLFYCGARKKRGVKIFGGNCVSSLELQQAHSFSSCNGRSTGWVAGWPETRPADEMGLAQIFRFYTFTTLSFLDDERDKLMTAVRPMLQRSGDPLAAV